MKSYVLLRNNKESGPFSFEEIAEMKLKPFDLIWIEGESSKWNYPEDIESLKDIVKYEEIKEHIGTPNEDSYNGRKIFISLPTSHQQNSTIEQHETAREGSKDEEPQLQTRFCQPLEVLNEQQAKRLQEKKFKFENKVKHSYALKIAATFFGIILCAFIFKKIIEALDGKALESNVATAAAIRVEPSTGIDEEKNTDASEYQNALTTEIVPPEPEHKALKKVKPKSLSKLVSLKGNEYKVGLFGGINDLQLTVSNKSEFSLDKVEIEVQYLKPNGKKAKTDFYEVNTIAPKSSKILSVPSSNRGVKVQYHIINIISKEHKKLLEV